MAKIISYIALFLVIYILSSGGASTAAREKRRQCSTETECKYVCDGVGLCREDGMCLCRAAEEESPSQVGPPCSTDADCDHFCGGPKGGHCDIDGEICHCL